MQNGVDILSELKKGNTEALHAIHDLYYPGLRRFSNSLLGDVPAAEDIVTEVFITLWKKQRDFETMQNIKAFLYISTRNACINHIKRLQRDSAMKAGLSHFLAADSEEFVLNEMIRAEVLQQIYEAIESLPLQCRRVFKLCYVEGMSNAEVADECKISINTVKNHKVKALGVLRLRFLHNSSVAFLAVCLHFLPF